MIRSDRPSEEPGEEMLAVTEIEQVGQEGSLSDAQLLWRMRSREQAALGELYDRHGALAFGLALRMLGDRALAEEVVQDAFLALWSSAATYDPARATVKSWLLTVVRRRAIDRLRRRSAKDTADTIDDSPELVSEYETWPSVAAQLRADEVRLALRQLPSDQLQIVELAYFQGLSQSEIAELRGIPVGTVKSRTRLAFGRLRGLLDATLASEEPER